MATTTVEVFVLVDSNADSAVGADTNEARENYENNVGPLSEADGFRLVKVMLTVPLPEISIVELTAEAPPLEDASA